MDSIRFTLDGVAYTLTREEVLAKAGGAPLQPIQKLGVRVGRQWLPVKQAFGLAIGLDSNQFNSVRAFDLLRKLDFEMYNAELDGPEPPESSAARRVSGTSNRLAALELSVELLKARPSASGALVVAIAEEFAVWLDGAGR